MFQTVLAGLVTWLLLCCKQSTRCCAGTCQFEGRLPEDTYCCHDGAQLTQRLCIHLVQCCRWTCGVGPILYSLLPNSSSDALVGPLWLLMTGFNSRGNRLQSWKPSMKYMSTYRWRPCRLKVQDRYISAPSLHQCGFATVPCLVSEHCAASAANTCAAMLCRPVVHQSWRQL